MKRRKAKTKRPKGRLSDHPAMQRLAEIVAELPEDRREALGNFMDRTPLSDQLRAAIEAAPMSRYALWKATGVSQARLSRFVHHQGDLRLDAIDRIVAVLALELRPQKRLNGKNR